MGGNGPLRTAMSHFFEHHGAPGFDPDKAGDLIEATEASMRASGTMQGDEVLVVSVQKIADLEKTDPDLAQKKQAVLGR